ncbi:MAG: C1 family peptidase [Anaerolineae bacterium]
MTRHNWRKTLGWPLVLALIVGLLPLLAAAAPATGQTPANVVVDAGNSGGQVHLAVDQALTVRLQANPATGYLWDVAQVNGQVLQQVGVAEFEPDSSLLGAPGTVTLRFRPAGAGETILALAYRRPWEKAPALAEFSIQVVADGASAASSAPRAPASARQAARSEPAPAVSEAQGTTALPSAFNWCDLGGCTPIKNQASCGSCWAFGTVGVLESQIKLQDGVTRDLSEQYLVSCNTDGWGCDGGWWGHDYHEWKVPPGEYQAGAVYEADFGYVAADVACNPPHDHHEKIVSWEKVNGDVEVPSVAELKQAIYDHGPVAVAMCAGSALSNYTGGVFATNEYCKYTVNHGVILVGWDDGRGAWRMRNSWSSAWGESGYAWVAYGTSYIGEGATYVEYESTIPPAPPAAPDNLRVLFTSRTEAHLAWDDNSDNESGFQVERSPNGYSNWADVGQVGANVTTYTDGGLDWTTTYSYRLHAYNEGGDSAYSNTVTATTQGDYPQAIYLPLVERGAGAAPPATLLTEDFEAGQMPPPGWSTADSNVNGHNWDLVNGWTYPEYVHNGNYSAWVNFDSSYASDEGLLTPVIDLRSASAATLQFWALSDTNWCNANMLLRVTDAVGNVLGTPWNMCIQENWSEFTYRQVTVDLSAYTGQRIKLAWEYAGIDGESFGLDDVSVSATTN